MVEFFLTGQTRSDPIWPFFSPTAGETTGQTGSDRVWPFKKNAANAALADCILLIDNDKVY